MGISGRKFEFCIRRTWYSKWWHDIVGRWAVLLIQRYVEKFLFGISGRKFEFCMRRTGYSKRLRDIVCRFFKKRLYQESCSWLCLLLEYLCSPDTKLKFSDCDLCSFKRYSSLNLFEHPLCQENVSSADFVLTPGRTSCCSDIWSQISAWNVFRFSRHSPLIVFWKFEVSGSQLTIVFCPATFSNLTFSWYKMPQFRLELPCRFDNIRSWIFYECL